jgi:hypothetical protein
MSQPGFNQIEVPPAKLYNYTIVKQCSLNTKRNRVNLLDQTREIQPNQKKRYNPYSTLTTRHPSSKEDFKDHANKQKSNCHFRCTTKASRQKPNLKKDKEALQQNKKRQNNNCMKTKRNSN